VRSRTPLIVVLAGPNGGPEDIVRRRYAAGLRCLFDLYPEVVDSWPVYDNASFADPHRVVSAAAGALAIIADPIAWNRLRTLR
jgi:predicted ABC-type ATPase